MKKIYFVFKITLLVSLITLLNIPVNAIKAQAVKYPPLKKDKEKSVDSLNSIAKYKIKSMTVLSYFSNDSTLAKAKLESKEKTVYNHDGQLTEFITENGNGKMISRTESKYDSRNNAIESISYDSVNKISADGKYYYDDMNRVIESSTSMPLSTYTGKPEDADKYVAYTDKSKYDVNGNWVDFTNDSAGVIISKITSKFDNKNRVVYSEQYSHAVLQSTQTLAYDAKGAFTETTEYYWSASKTQCSPNKNRTVSKFDSKKNLLSSLSISDENGIVSTNKTTNEYKYYDAAKLLSVKTVTENNSDGFSSKAISSSTYTYDKNGNVTESTSKYGGGGGNYITRYKYNSTNSVVEEIVYNGSCMNKPSTITTYTYYADGKTLKESVITSYDYPSKTIDKYDERSLLLESISTSEDGSEHAVYTYESW